MKKIIVFTLIFGFQLFGHAGQKEQPDFNYLLALPKLVDLPMPILIVLPGRNVPAKNEQANWKFMARKRGFALINMDIDYSLIKADSDVDQLRNRLFEIIRDLRAEGVNLDEKRVYLAGSSMGGMMAISLSLRYPKDFLATSIVCGGRLRFGADQFLDNAKGLLFYLAHGEKDNVVPVEDFYHTKESLESHGATVSADLYPGAGHILSGAYRKAVDWLPIKS